MNPRRHLPSYTGSITRIALEYKGKFYTIWINLHVTEPRRRTYWWHRFPAHRDLENPITYKYYTSNTFRKIRYVSENIVCVACDIYNIRARLSFTNHFTSSRFYYIYFQHKFSNLYLQSDIFSVIPFHLQKHS